MEPAEFTFICIDNAVFWTDPFHRAQQDAIKFYCETLFKCNPDNAVCLFLMTDWKLWAGPTRDLQEISRYLEHVPCFGGMKSSNALSVAAKTLNLVPPHMKRRLLMFVASPLDDVRAGYQTHPALCGRLLKESDVALHVFNFFLSKSKTSGYYYMRNYLDILVKTVNHNDNSSLEDVDKSDIRDKLSNSILKENFHHLSKPTCSEMNRAAAGVRDIELSDFSLINKLHGLGNRDVRVLSSPPARVVRVKQTDVSITSVKEKAEEDVSVKQGLELSCNEKNKAAAQGISNEYVEPNLLSKKKKKAKRSRKKMLKQGSELSCNEKNQAAVEYGKHSPPCAEEDVSVKQGLELYCNEKNKEAAQVICTEYVKLTLLAYAYLINKKLSSIEKNEAAAAAAEYGKHSPPCAEEDVSAELTKETIYSSVKLSREKAEEDVSVKQGLELSCNEKNKAAAAQGISNECVEPKLLSKKKKKKAKRYRKKMLKQGSELSCNEENQAAVEYGKYSPPCAEENDSVKLGYQQPWHDAYISLVLNKLHFPPPFPDHHM